MHFSEDIRHIEHINYTPLDISRFHYAQKYWIKNTIVVVLFMASLFTAGYYYFYEPQEKLNTVQAAYDVMVVKPPVEPMIAQTVDIPEPGPTMQDRIKIELEDTTGNYGIVVKNLKTGESFFLNENKAVKSRKVS